MLVPDAAFSGAKQQQHVPIYMDFFVHLPSMIVPPPLVFLLLLLFPSLLYSSLFLPLFVLNQLNSILPLLHLYLYYKILQETLLFPLYLTILYI